MYYSHIYLLKMYLSFGQKRKVAGVIIETAISIARSVITSRNIVDGHVMDIYS